MKDINMELAIEILKENFIKNFKEDFNPIPMGFQKLDQKIGGGLKPGLYVLGAKPGAGKSTFLLQLAHQISRQNKSVILFSFDKQPNSLIIKLISHHTFEISKDPKISKTIEQVEDCVKQESLPKKEQDLMDQAYYLVYANDDNLQMMDTCVNCLTINQIKQSIKAFQDTNKGDTPIVLIDDLQFLSTGEQGFAKNIKDLKKLAYDYETPIFCSSKFKLNPDERIDSSLFHVSVKCNADVLLALRNKTPNSKKSPRKLELIVLKNRNENDQIKIDFDYYAQFNYFE